MAEKFGADLVLNVSEMSAEAVVAVVRDACPVDGPDAVIEVCGVPDVIPDGLRMLRKGGRYVIAGIVFPDANVNVDANLILTKWITIRGVHNYHPRHLVEALDFVYRNRGVFPFKELINGRFRLDDLDTAFKQAAERQVLRAAIVP
jgi:threonine dehydrogenase-like Zn-dependent dehydrogenase